MARPGARRRVEAVDLDAPVVEAGRADGDELAVDLDLVAELLEGDDRRRGNALFQRPLTCGDVAAVDVGCAIEGDGEEVLARRADDHDVALRIDGLPEERVGDRQGDVLLQHPVRAGGLLLVHVDGAVVGAERVVAVRADEEAVAVDGNLVSEPTETRAGEWRELLLLDPGLADGVASIPEDSSLGVQAVREHAAGADEQVLALKSQRRSELVGVSHRACGQGLLETLSRGRPGRCEGQAQSDGGQEQNVAVRARGPRAGLRRLHGGPPKGGVKGRPLLSDSPMPP